MEKFKRKEHWEKIYQTKKLEEVSWYQETPTISLSFVEQLNISKHSKIIDIGGGDSYFVDNLLARGYEDITVLDISESAIKKAKKRLGVNANKVKWIISDVTNFKPDRRYDFWHDRAAFHFITVEEEMKNYVSTVQSNLNQNGILIVGTFSKEGPKKCSGIEICQYSEHSMTETFSEFFKKIECKKVDHKTPFDSIQNFIFCSFRKLDF